MARALVLHNPAAGGAPGPALVGQIEREFRLAGFSVESAASAARGHIESLCRAAASEGVERVAVCGGDGTIREAASGLCGSGVALGIIPLGTVNVLARELGLPIESPVACAVTAARGKAVSVGLGQVTGGGVFTFCASAGLDSLAVASVDPLLKGQTGAWAYVHAGLTALLGGEIPRFSVKPDGHKPFAAYQLFALRTKLYGSGFLRISGRADLMSPTFRLVAIVRPLAIRLPLLLAGMLSGGLEGASGVVCLDSVEAEVTSEWPFPIQADGDAAGSTPAVIRSIPDALHVAVP